MKWLLIDNIMPGRILCCNLSNVTDFKWERGTLTIGYVDNTKDEYECEQDVFIDILKKLDVIHEV